MDEPPLTWENVGTGETATEASRSFLFYAPKVATDHCLHGEQLFRDVNPQRQRQQVLLRSLLGQPVQPGDVLELFGAEGSGKTELLLEMIVSVILPRVRG
jgi:ABC-type protease/lipase transport system fused ATPase/permease subunit